MTDPTTTTADFTPDALEAAGALTAVPDPGYQWPADPRTRAALEHWRDLKVGVIMHWGIYSAIGQSGSWSLHREHLGEFTDPPAGWSGTAAEYHTWYNRQAETFRGADYDPAEWARMCSDAGLRYLVLTTKHHDGFALYDTDQSNFKSTAEDCGLGRDIVAETFQAFRAEGLETGVYFSKADWNHPGYWDRAQPIRDRFHNYDLAEKTAKWRSFVEYTHRQIDELLTRYGRINVLWLDAGWVREPDEPIGIDAIADRARELQPDILVVDREVHGRNENYRTPEQQLPDARLDHPWESCITMTRSWCSETPDDPAKPIGEIAATLVRIVARGGNYLIGVGPDASGRLSRHVAERMRELGEILRDAGHAIYGSRPADPGLTASGTLEWHLTSPSGRPEVVYAIGLYPDGVAVPSTVRVTGNGHDVTVAVPAGSNAHVVVAEIPLGTG
ncbi:alpha-L-fucosidase [Actinoplanes sp. DH11]|uniref:alpha-L-fucosidase n=1 Tax=Actinoplanes sp. DH11 TaxID=2857011 RepID=UPI001E485CF4|nr:alpha-L-fucosidase [Actinoplanes sp. DH11]